MMSEQELAHLVWQCQTRSPRPSRNRRGKAVIRAYLDQLAVWPGDDVIVRAQGDVAGSTRVVEFLHSDPDPRGPGVISSPCEWGAGTFSATGPETAQGSFAFWDGSLAGDSGFTMSLWVFPTDLSEIVTVASWGAQAARWRLDMSRTGIELVGPDGSWMFALPVHERVWCFVGIVASPNQGATLFASPWGRTGGPFAHTFHDAAVSVDDAGFCLGTADGKRGNFDGQMAGVRLHEAGLDIVDLMNVMNGFGPSPLHEWRFDDRTDPDSVPDAGGGAALALRNAPTWSAAHPAPVADGDGPVCSRGSIHFHRDDVEDCGWSMASRTRIPDDAQSGVYVVRLTADGETQDLPFIVKGAAEVALLMPTLTWQAYSNLGRGPDWPGRSHYALHSDGSPVMITTSRKPSQTFAPSARLEVDASDSFATGENLTHLLMADLYAWNWIKGAYPDRACVIDDLELHFSPDALATVKVLVLSAHPEYWTATMLDALQRHIDRGGHVIYLGGNGLYWVVSLHPTKPHLMELRRWGGSQTWSADRDDLLHQFEPCQGGLWEDNGRPPNDLVGVGFAGFGNGPSLEYVRTPQSYDQEWAWLFEGLAGETFGSLGINNGAGNEYDSFDPQRPGPGKSSILAIAAPVRPDHFGTFEMKGHRAPDPEVRADLVATATPAGGVVLAVSAISASSSLSSTVGDGMALILGNALRRMLDDDPLGTGFRDSAH